MPNKRKLKLHVDDGTANVLLDEAEKLVEAHGLDGLKLAELASRVGIKVSSIYHHYPDGRQQLLGAMINRVVKNLQNQFRHSPDESPKLALSRGLRDFASYLIDHPAHVRIILLDLATPGGVPMLTRLIGPIGESTETGGLRGVIERLDNVLVAGQAAGVFRQINVTRLFNLILSYSLLSLVDPRTNTELFPDELIDIVMLQCMP